MKYSVGIPGREEVTLDIDLEKDGQIKSAKVHAVGSWDFLRLVQELRKRLVGEIHTVTAPQGSSTGAMLVRELLLKAQGLWQPPYVEDELCHCRGVPTKNVELAILSGAHTPVQVSAQTSASTACGTCRPNVEALISYRLGGKP